jgi:tetratricopeptide (TPR) repeat protein
MPSIFDKLFKSKPSAAPPTAPSQPAQSQPSADSFETIYAKALAAVAAKDFERAIPLYDRAIAANPDNAEPYYKRANALKDVGRLEAAVASYNQAIERKPDYAYAYCNRGVIQHRLGLMAAAMSSLDQAVALEPTDAVAHYNRAMVLQDCSRWNDAVASYNQALAINPQYADAQFNRSLTLLYLGDFENGWPAFEWRLENTQRLGIAAKRDLQQPRWLGDASIAGKRLLIYHEQGLGDTIQFCRYAKLAAARGASVILEVPASLLDLLCNLEGVSQVVAMGSTLPPFDYHCSLMSLPLAFNTTAATIPAPPKYLSSDAGKVARWRTILGERTRPRVGLVWSGNPNNHIDNRRSIALADLEAHLPPEFQYFRLQKDVRPTDRARLDASSLILSYTEALQDFSNTAALCECMDVVLSVDTSLAHLGAAMGLRTWILLAFTPDWRWTLGRADSPWYPTAKLYQQRSAGDWEEVLTRVAADLRREFPTG